MRASAGVDAFVGSALEGNALVGVGERSASAWCSEVDRSGAEGQAGAACALGGTGMGLVDPPVPPSYLDSLQSSAGRELVARRREMAWEWVGEGQGPESDGGAGTGARWKAREGPRPVVRRLDAVGSARPGRIRQCVDPCGCMHCCLST